MIGVTELHRNQLNVSSTMILNYAEMAIALSGKSLVPFMW